eukprot:EG_transcript_58156
MPHIVSSLRTSMSVCIFAVVSGRFATNDVLPRAPRLCDECGPVCSDCNAFAMCRLTHLSSCALVPMPPGAWLQSALRTVVRLSLSPSAGHNLLPPPDHRLL